MTPVTAAPPLIAPCMKRPGRPVIERFFLRSKPALFRQTRLAMGTEITVSIVLGAHRRTAAQAAMRELHQLLTSFSREAWAWGPGALADFNRRLLRGEQAEIPPALLPLFQRAWALHLSTRGRFEPRMAALVRLWGFDDPARLRTSPPSQAQISQAVQALQLAPPYDGGSHYGPAPDVAWDFGAIGKGYIVDAALQLLKTRGFAHCTINAGGHVAATGARGDRPWRTGIRDHRAPADQPALLASLDVFDESVVTHGDDQRYFEHEGQRYAHLLNPGNGWAVQGLRALTVVHADGALADAAGAALFVAGPGCWPALAAELGLTQVLAVDVHGVVQTTAALASRLRLVEGQQIQVLAQQ